MDVRFIGGGPYDGQVRPVVFGLARVVADVGGLPHLYRLRRVETRAAVADTAPFERVVLGATFEYAGIRKTPLGAKAAP